MARPKSVYDLYDLAQQKGVVVEQTLGEDEFLISERGTGMRLGPWLQGLDKAFKWLEQYEKEHDNA
jgi:hypothetical protein